MNLLVWRNRRVLRAINPSSSLDSRVRCLEARTKKKASRSLRTAGLDLILRGDSPYAGRDSILCALANAKKLTKSAGRLRIRTPDWPPAPFFNCRQPAPRRQDPPFLASCYEADSRFPTLLHEVQGRQTQANDNKAQGEQGEGRQQLADKVKLERSDTPQKPPNPLAKAIFGVHGFCIPPKWPARGDGWIPCCCG